MSYDHIPMGPYQRGFPSFTRIALIVSDDPDAQREAMRYVGKLPDTAFLYLNANRPFVRDAKALARRHKVGSRVCRTAPEAVTMANVVVIFGDSPFDSGSVDILMSQGIAVEVEPGKKRKRQRGRPPLGA